MKKILILLFAVSSIFASQGRGKYWIVFKDKGTYENISLAKGSVFYEKFKKSISSRAFERRLKTVGDETKVFDYYDIPVFEGYVEKLKELGIGVLVVSKWLNAVSAYIDEGKLDLVRNLHFVSEVTPVARSVKTFIESPVKLSTIDYGTSELQIKFTNTDKLHKMNIIGKDILVGMMDTGFRWRTHESLKDINVVAEYDFIFGDTITANQSNDASSQDFHGTLTLSVLGGKKDGKLYGSAFGASFVLAKTEDVRSETPVEEDYWVRAIEWMDSLGVDVVSSSLGYLDWYTYQDMDGKTAKITKAADIAFQKGIVVVNSAGNERNTPWRYIIAPADGKYVIAVGAVRSDSTIASFSSMGPTYDGRIKPEVCALGVGVYGASPSEKVGDSYVFASGTSLSCPLVAGICALVLSTHRELSSFQVREALLRTSHRADNPDNDYGYGIPNALEMALYFGPIISNFPEIKPVGGGFEISIYAMSKNGIKEVYLQTLRGKFSMIEVEPNRFSILLPDLPESYSIFVVDQADRINSIHIEPKFVPEKFWLSDNFPNPFNSSTRFVLWLPEPLQVEIKIYNILGQKVRTLVNKFYPSAGEYIVSWDGRDDLGNAVPSGVYFARLESVKFSAVRKIVLVR